MTGFCSGTATMTRPGCLTRTLGSLQNNKYVWFTKVFPQRLHAAKCWPRIFANFRLISMVFVTTEFDKILVLQFVDYSTNNVQNIQNMQTMQKKYEFMKVICW